MLPSNFRPQKHKNRPEGGLRWRRVRDSNPRAPRRAASFQDWCIQPLYQLSVDRFMGFGMSIQVVVVMTQCLFLANLCSTAHVVLKSFRNRHRTIFTLIVLKDSDQGSSYSQR